MEGGDVKRRIRHSDEGEMSFRCSARSDDSTEVNSTWYKLERDESTGHMYEMRVYNRSHKLSISGPYNTLTIKLPANDSEGWAKYGGEYLCRADNGYSSDERLITISVVDIPASGTHCTPLRYLDCFKYVHCAAKTSSFDYNWYN